VKDRIDFNADLGESFGSWEKGADLELLDCITSANVACGFHAGDPGTMALSVNRVAENGLSLGAHPGYPDLLGFGRRRLEASPAEIDAYVTYQVGALLGFAARQGLALHHVKPHGALYVTALDDRPTADAIASAVAAIAPGVAIYTLLGSEMWLAAEEANLRPVAEFFVDRPIRSDGSYDFFGWHETFDLDVDRVAERALRALTEGRVRSQDGSDVEVMPETMCLHSDTPRAGVLGARIRNAIQDAGIELVAA
jgi:UPF0271 protein